MSHDDQGGLKSFFGKGIGSAKVFVKGNLIVNKDELEEWKKYIGKGLEVTNGVVAGLMVIDKNESEKWKSFIGKGLEFSKGLVYGGLAAVVRDSVNLNVGRSLEATKGFLQGGKVFSSMEGYKYLTKITNAGQVNVLDKATKNWIFRLDKPHKGANFNHININPKFSGLRRDPHLKIPTGSLYAGQGVAKVGKIVNTINEVAIPVMIAIDVYKLYSSAVKDMENSTSRNTVETSANIAGIWCGGAAGAKVGSAVGTAILPGMGTILGGLIGSIGGGVGLALSANSVVGDIADKYNYDTVDKKCEDCDEVFKVRKYKGENINDHKHSDSECNNKNLNADFAFPCKL